jgi:hypothetical protein
MPRTFAAVIVTILLLPSLLLTAQTNVTGRWNAVVELDLGSGEPVFEFTQEGETVTGTYQGTFGSAELKGLVSGDQIEFTFEAEGVGEATYTGIIRGESMEGTCDYGPIGGGTWTAMKSE